MPRRHFQCIVIFLLVTLIVLLSPIRFFTEEFAAGLQQELLPSPPHPIPHKIWQLDPRTAGASSTGTLDTLDDALRAAAMSWIARNPDYEYTLLTAAGATALLPRFPKAQRVPLATILSSPRLEPLRAALLPYIILAAVGGTYADRATTALATVASWVPEEHRARTHAVVGMAYDQRGDAELRAGYTHPVQLAPWAFAAARGHPTVLGMVARVLAGAAELASHQRIALGELSLNEMEVERLVGAASWSGAVFQAIQAASGRVVTFAELSGLSAPRLFRDILVLPINSFGLGQNHSGSTLDEKGALIRHHFATST